MDHLPAYQRVEKGRSWENKIRNCLNTYEGYNLVESSHYEDCHEKTDCWQKTKSGKMLRAAIKVRLNKKGDLDYSKTDILVSLFDPFYGIDHPENKKGRDMVYEYSMYISVAKGDIRVVKGVAVHSICNGLWDEYLSLGKVLNPKERGFGAKIVLQSDKYSGCQIWLNYDSKSGKPKLLAFIPPEFFKKNKEIKTHKFFEV